MARREGALFKDGRGLWTAVVELPSYNGDRRRKVVRSKDKRTAQAKLRALLAERDQNGGDLATRDVTVTAWIHEWLEQIASKKLRPKTLSTYKGLIRREIEPAIGKIKLARLAPRDVRLMLDGITGKGLSSTTAMQVHRILAVALKYAQREGKVPRNVAALVDAPRRAAGEVGALNVDEALKVLEVAADDPLGSLWAAVLLTGARQGELLGLQRDRVGEELELSWQLQRLSWEHGCDPFCGRKRGTDCRSRKLTAAPDWESQNLIGGLWLSRPKSIAGWRIIPLVDPLAAILRQHIADTEDEVNPHNLVWHNADGSPLDPRQESKLWHDLLERAKVTSVGIHSGRHTTVDLLYIAGVPEDIIMEIVGHSTRAVTRGYKSRGNQLRLIEAMQGVSRVLAAGKAAHVQIGAHDLHGDAELEADAS